MAEINKLKDALVTAVRNDNNVKTKEIQLKIDELVEKANNSRTVLRNEGTVFCYKTCSDLLGQNIVLVIEKNF